VLMMFTVNRLGKGRENRGRISTILKNQNCHPGPTLYRTRVLPSLVTSLRTHLSSTRLLGSSEMSEGGMGIKMLRSNNNLASSSSLSPRMRGICICIHNNSNISNLGHRVSTIQDSIHSSHSQALYTRGIPNVSLDNQLQFQSLVHG